MKYFFPSLLWLLLLNPHTTCAQENEIQFNIVTGANNQPLGKITAMGQDNDGYMWFAGQGEKCLYRYDGIRWKIYRQNVLDTTSLAVYEIETIHVDREGMVWIGGNSLDQFDPKTGVFRHYKHQPNDPRTLPAGNVNVILQDKEGILWVGLDTGLAMLDPSTGKFSLYTHNPSDPRSLTDNVVRSLYEDRQGVLWVGTGYPFFNIDPEKGGLNRLEADGTFTRFLHDPNDPQSLINNKVRSIFEDSRGVFWVGTSGDGLHTLDRKTGKFQRHQYDPANPGKLSRPPRKTEPWKFMNDQVTFITEDCMGSIWIGTMCAGIRRYNPATGQITDYESRKDFIDGSGWNAFQSRDGVMWVSTQEDRLFRLNFIRPRVESTETGVRVHRFIEDGSGTLWVATEMGLYEFDANRKLRKRHLMDSINLESPSNNTHALFLTSPDSLWVGTYNGFGIYNTRTKKFSNFAEGTEYSDMRLGRVINIIRDHLGYMWIGTQKGLIRYHPGKRLIKWYRKEEGVTGSIRSSDIVTVMEDRSGNIWAGTFDGGLNLLDRKTDTFRYYLESAKETFLYNDKTGGVWAGTPTGLFQYDQKSDRFFAFGEGSVLGRDRIFAVAQDAHDNIWVATPEALTRISQDRTEFFTFDKNVGISGIAPGAILNTVHGHFLIGHHTGFYTVIPERLSESTDSIKILISDILVNNEPFANASPRSGLTEDVSSLNLRHNQNNVVLRFAAMDYRAMESTRYFTMLEGNDDVWREASSDRTSYFNNLPPGNYTYRVKAINTFGSLGIKTLLIRIDPPWWQTWWAYSLYVVLMICALWIGRREVVRRERFRADLEMERLKLKKAREVDSMKSAFFTNISHEFRTPLTLIQGLANELQEEFSGNKKVKERLRMIGKNSDLLLRLILQLMDLSRLESGSVQITRTQCNVNLFIRNRVHAFSSLMAQKKIGFDIILPKENYIIMADEAKVETILINLLSNAIKFTPAGGSVSVSAEVVQASSENGIGDVELHLWVKDTGIGIPLEHQAKIFDRFFQVKDDHKETGTGVGLSLVSEFATLMGGTVSVTSEPGKGSSFHVRLPAVKVNKTFETLPPLPQTKPTEIHSDSNGSEENAEGKPVILVVEDNADLIQFIISALGNEYRYISASDGKAGLELAFREIPDLIVSDIMMPEMDGIEMAKRLKSDLSTSHIPVILLTAKASEVDKLSGLETGADDYLTKPFNRKELVLKVQNSIATRARLRENIRLRWLQDGPEVKAISADEQFVINVKNIILERLSDEQLGVDMLAHEIGLSRAQLYRKVSALTGTSPNELIKSFRLKKAAKLLEQHWSNVSQIAFEVGFSNPSYFSKCFKAEYGVMPSEYASKVKSV